MIVTVDDVLRAADVIERVSQIYDLAPAEHGEWSASDLRNEIPALEAHFAHENMTQRICDEVMELIMAGAKVENALKSVLGEYELRQQL